MELELLPLGFEDPEQDRRANPKAGKPKYEGVERRRDVRRLCMDRRAMLRFEPGQADRRSGNDRRAENAVWNNFYR